MKKTKKTLSYLAIFEPAIEGGFNVSFPDFPGCVTFGDNFKHAQKMAKEALELWLEELAAEKEEIPPSSSNVVLTNIKVAFPR